MKPINKFDCLKLLFQYLFMIYEDNWGSINAFYKGKMIVSRPAKKIDNLRLNASTAILEGLRSGWTIQRFIDFNLKFIKRLRYEEMNKIPGEEDWDIAMIAVLMLIKLKAIDEDGDKEGLLIMGPKKVRLKNETPVRQF
tara:strand:- start:1161 stop:1577 length:417 start_codon:yes stop_codon:yes gene_type:complete